MILNQNLDATGLMHEPIKPYESGQAETQPGIPGESSFAFFSDNIDFPRVMINSGSLCKKSECRETKKPLW